MGQTNPAAAAAAVAARLPAVITSVLDLCLHCSAQTASDSCIKNLLTRLKAAAAAAITHHAVCFGYAELDMKAYLFSSKSCN